MTNENKQPAEFKITKEGLLITVIVGLVIIIFGIIAAYFIVNVIYISELSALKKILSNNGRISTSYEWWKILFAQLSPSDEPLNIRDIFIGFAGLVTLIFAGWRLIIIDQQKEDQVKRTNIELDRRLSERFDNAAAALSKDLNDSLFPAHLGAISSLRILATDSPEHTQRCLDIICSCNQWMEGYMDEFISAKSRHPYSSWLLKEDNRITNKNKGSNITLLQEKRSQQALVAISYILEKISTNNLEQLKELKFHNMMLCGISLSGLKLDGIDFHNTYLVAAALNNISLKKARLGDAHLEGAYLWQANLQGASLGVTHLEGASLDFANLQGASLNDAHLEGASLDDAHLEGASLDDAHLEGTSLDDAHLEGASLIRAHLEGAYLRRTHLGRSSLYDAHLEGAFLEGTSLQETQLINTKLQGASLDNIDLSYAILLDCNLYGIKLEVINSEGIIFNDIVDTGYIQNKVERKKFLDDICQHLKPPNIKPFIEKMEAAWQAMENIQEPDGLRTIREDSIVIEDNKGMYDISKESFNNLEKRWQNRINEKGIEFLINMRYSISTMIRNPFSFSQITSKNINLVKKLEVLTEKLIKSNKRKKGGLAYLAPWRS